MRHVAFIPEAFKEYIDWFDAVAKRIIMIIKDISVSFFFKGYGKPEPLSGNCKGYWSRLINKKTVWYKR